MCYVHVRANTFTSGKNKRRGEQGKRAESHSLLPFSLSGIFYKYIERGNCVLKFFSFRFAFGTSNIEQ